MIITIHQPNYLPWLGFFHKIILSDVYVAFDDVQFEKNSFNNRNKVKINENQWTWLTVPILTSGKSKRTMINTAKIKGKSNWEKKHFKTLKFHYSRSKYYESYIDFFKDLYNQEWQILSELNIYILKWLFEQLNINTKLILSSNIKDKEGSKDDLVLSICNYFNADLYISGKNGRDYIKEDKFDENNIKTHYQNYVHPEYKQLGEKFSSHMSIVDLLFNYGPKSKDIIMKNNITKKGLKEKYNLT